MTLFNYALSALGASVSGTTPFGGFVLANLIDGNELTYYRQNTGNIPTIVVDIGAPQYVTQLRVNKSNSGSFTLSYSNDGVDYIAFGTTGGSIGDVTYDLGGITARYWKFLGSTSSSWAIYTIALLGPIEVPPPPVAIINEPIQAWLDGIEQYFVPAVRDWLDGG